MKPKTTINTTVLLMCSMPLVVNHHPWDLVWVGVMAVWMPIMIRSYINGDPRVVLQRKRELFKQRTRELEAELDIEPLNFSDLPDEVAHDLKKEL